MRGDNNVVNNNLSSEASEDRTPDDERRDLPA